MSDLLIKDEVLTELKDKIDDSYKTINQFKTDNDKALKEGKAELGEHKEKVDKMFDDITKTMELVQKLDAKMKAIESLPNFMGQENLKADEKYKKEVKEIFKEFARKGANNETFQQYCEKNNFEIKKLEFGMETKALSVNSDENGGFLVMPTFGGIVTTRIFETSPMRQIANVETISSDALELVADNDEVDSAYVGEEGTRSETNTSTLDKLRIPVYEQYAQPKTTQKFLDDAIIDVESWLANKVADKLKRTANARFVTGAGVVSPRGFMTYDNWTTAGTYEAGKVEQIASGDAADFTADGILDLQNALIEDYQTNAVWATKRTNFKNIAKLKDGDDNYLFNRALDKNVGRPFDLLGQPVIFMNDIASVAANALALAYGDFKQGYYIVDRIGIRILRDPYTSKGFVKFYTTVRNGGAVVNYEAIKIQKLATSV